MFSFFVYLPFIVFLQCIEQKLMIEIETRFYPTVFYRNKIRRLQNHSIIVSKLNILALSISVCKYSIQSSLGKNNKAIYYVSANILSRVHMERITQLYNTFLVVKLKHIQINAFTFSEGADWSGSLLFDIHSESLRLGKPHTFSHFILVITVQIVLSLNILFAISQNMHFEGNKSGCKKTIASKF